MNQEQVLKFMESKKTDKHSAPQPFNFQGTETAIAYRQNVNHSWTFNSPKGQKVWGMLLLR